MKLGKSICILLFLLLSGSILADEAEITNYSGRVTFSVNAVDQLGYDCSIQHAQHYLLTEVPLFFSSEFAKHGLLFGQDIGTYRIALLIDENSVIRSHKTLEMGKNSRVEKTILKLGALPRLGEQNQCIAGKVYIYTINIR